MRESLPTQVRRTHDVAAEAPGLDAEAVAVRNEQFSVFYRRALPLLVNRARFVCRSVGIGVNDAADIVQDVLCGVLRRWDELEYPLAYAHTAVSRAVIDTSRRQSRETSIADMASLEWWHSVHTLAATVDDDIDDVEIRRLIRSLSETDRSLVGLIYLGFKPAEVPSALKMPRASVYRHLKAIAAQVSGVPSLLDALAALQPPEAGRPVPIEMITQLPPRQRQVMELIEQGLSPSQVAHRLDITPNAARVTLHQARRKVTRLQHTPKTGQQPAA
jgi:DNA-directed RNA polymerase specialized sigma24 family protein